MIVFSGSAEAAAPAFGATGFSLPSRTRRLSSCVWCTTSSSTPNSAYSFLRELKQCAQVETTFLAFVSFSTSEFSMASCMKTISLPARRAGSPVQVSPSPRIANSTPAVCSSSATACVVFFARSSKAPAQPTQNSHSTSSRLSTSTPTCLTSKSRPLVQSRRFLGFMPHGFPLRSRPLKMLFSSAGKLLSTSTWKRRMSSMWSTCSMSTGHCCTQAPQFVHDHRTSGSMTPYISSSPMSGRSTSFCCSSVRSSSGTDSAGIFA